jgi:hypothetical protein
LRRILRCLLCVCRSLYFVKFVYISEIESVAVDIFASYKFENPVSLLFLALQKLQLEVATDVVLAFNGRHKRWELRFFMMICMKKP